MKFIWKDKLLVCFKHNDDEEHKYLHISNVLSSKGTDHIKHLLFDVCSVPKDLTLKERMSYFILLVPDTIDYKYSWD